MVKKEDARVVRTKKNIEETAIVLLTAQSDFSINVLLERADVTRGTFYKYYQNKEHLISEVNHKLVLEFVKHTQDSFHIAGMIQAVSDRAAFYNAVLNLHKDTTFFLTLMSHMRTQMQSQLGIIEDEDLYRRQTFQWEIITGGFWALIAKWLLDNMNIEQTRLLQEFVEVIRVNTVGLSQTGLNLFDFSSIQ
ncbi:TetR/AcrR family transcriptional regulator [Leuconostoc miyukkimchii]|uniref:TetR/AcrR family transcriptional regulator n=1 Tax=Leuconostoc miyukkimchii TaxID=910540 RepID=UPI001C7DC8B3|nr:TetR/AcrR family transcriptional regulator [Leuconostoc miyukkimchii]